MKRKNSLSEKKLISDFGCERLPDIEIKKETSQHINTILTDKRVQYVVTNEGEKIFLSKDQVAIKQKAYKLTLENGETKVIPIQHNSKIVNTGEELQVDGKEVYYYDDLKIVNTIIVANSSDILESTPLEKHYKKRRYTNAIYIPVESVQQQYDEAELGDISLMEITSLSDINNSERLKFLQDYFSEGNPNFNLKDRDFLEHISSLFSKALQIFKSRVGPLKYHEEFKKVENTSFDSIKDIKAFLQEASNIEKNRIKTTVYCTMLKFMYLFNEMEKKPLFKFIERIDNGEIDVKSMLSDIFKLDSSVEIQKDSKNIYQFPYTIGNSNTIIRFRVKNVRSILNKALAKGEYLDIDNFFDIFGMTVYIQPKDKKKLGKVLHELDIFLFKGEGYIKNKGLLKTKDIKNIKRKKYKVAAKNKQKNTDSNKNYDDCKVIGHTILEKKEGRDSIPHDLKLGFEAKAIIGFPEDETNETGLSWHPIYEHFGKFFKGEKNRQPFIPVSTFNKHIRNLYDKLCDIEFLEKNGKTKFEIFSEIYQELIPGKQLPSKPDYEKIFNEINTPLKAYLIKQHEMKTGKCKIGEETIEVLVTKDNEVQLLEGGRGYGFVK